MVPENWFMMKPRKWEDWFKEHGIAEELAFNCPYAGDDILSKSEYPKSPSLLRKYYTKLFPEYNSPASEHFNIDIIK